jgi:phage-related protein
VNTQPNPKPLHFVGDSDKNLRDFPSEVRSVIGQALKSKRGIQTPKQDIALIRQRLKTAEQHYQEHYPQEKKR